MYKKKALIFKKVVIKPLLHWQHKPGEEINVALQQLSTPHQHPTPSKDHLQIASVILVFRKIIG